MGAAEEDVRVGTDDDGADDGNDDGTDDGNDDGADDGNDDGTDDGNDDGTDDGNFVVHVRISAAGPLSHRDIPPSLLTFWPISV